MKSIITFGLFLGFAVQSAHAIKNPEKNCDGEWQNPCQIANQPPGTNAGCCWNGVDKLKNQTNISARTAGNPGNPGKHGKYGKSVKASTFYDYNQPLTADEIQYINQKLSKDGYKFRTEMWNRK